jgi:hypothetical protein
MATITQREEEEDVDVDGDANMKEEDIVVWHRKMGHLNGAEVKKL